MHRNCCAQRRTGTQAARTPRSPSSMSLGSTLNGFITLRVFRSMCGISMPNSAQAKQQKLMQQCRFAFKSGCSRPASRLIPSRRTKQGGSFGAIPRRSVPALHIAPSSSGGSSSKRAAPAPAKGAAYAGPANPPPTLAPYAGGGGYAANEA